MQALEFVAPEVGRELLELDGEAALAGGLVARQHDVGRAHHLAAVRLFPRRHEVELVELVLWRGPGAVLRRADEVQPVPDLRVQDVALIVPEPGGTGKKRKRCQRRAKGRDSLIKVIFFFFSFCGLQQQNNPVQSHLSLVANEQQMGPSFSSCFFLMLSLFTGNRCLHRETAVRSTAQIML